MMTAMLNCCLSSKDGTCSIPSAKLAFCPACGRRGKSVGVLTVKSLVRHHTRVVGSDALSFCRTLDCDVVYFSESTSFLQARLEGTSRDQGEADPAPLCFDYARADIRRDIEETGSTKIPDHIKAEIQGGFCACEVKNPSGICCLGDVIRAVEAAKSAKLTGSG
jgi:hypothetical protein